MSDAPPHLGKIDFYFAAFLTGLVFPAAYATVQRVRREYLSPAAKDDAELLQRPVLPYTQGEIVASITLPLVIISGIDDLVSKGDPGLFGATLGTLLISNTISSMYEFFRDQQE